MAEASISGNPSDASRQPTLRTNAQAMVRDWLQGRTLAIERLGQRECGASTDAISRIGHEGGSTSATSVLSSLQEVTQALTPQQARRPRWWPAGAYTRHNATTNLAPIIAQLERERDRLVRNLVTMKTIRQRVAEADEALDTVIRTVRSLSEVLQAARREVAGTADASPEGRLDDAERTLGERERAVVTQIAINRQALLTLDLLITNEITLQSALNDARTATVSALRLAEAARDAASTAMVLSGSQYDGGGQGAEGLTGWQQARRGIEDAMTKVRSIDRSQA
jgi:hypothetical protein